MSKKAQTKEQLIKEINAYRKKTLFLNTMRYRFEQLLKLALMLMLIVDCENQCGKLVIFQILNIYLLVWILNIVYNYKLFWQQ